MKIGPREQLILVIVGLVVVLIAVAGLLVWPQYPKQKALDTQIAAAEQKLSSAQALLSQRQEIKNRTAMTDAQWLELASLVPENPDLPSLIIELQDAAFASGVQVVAMTPAEPVSTIDHVSIPLNISVVGTWADTVDFMKSVNKLDRGVREMSFSTAVAAQKAAETAATVDIVPLTSGDPLFPDYSVSTALGLQAYYIPPGSTAATAPAAAPAPATP